MLIFYGNIELSLFWAIYQKMLYFDCIRTNSYNFGWIFQLFISNYAIPIIIAFILLEHIEYSWWGYTPCSPQYDWTYWSWLRLWWLVYKLRKWPRQLAHYAPQWQPSTGFSKYSVISVKFVAHLLTLFLLPLTICNKLNFKKAINQRKMRHEAKVLCESWQQIVVMRCAMSLWHTDILHSDSVCVCFLVVQKKN